MPSERLTTYTQLRLAMDGGGFVPASTTCISSPQPSSFCTVFDRRAPGSTAPCASECAAPCVLSGSWRDSASLLTSKHSLTTYGSEIHGFLATCTSMSGGSISDCSPSLGAFLLLEPASCGEAQHQGALAAPLACMTFICVTHMKSIACGALGYWRDRGTHLPRATGSLQLCKGRHCRTPQDVSCLLNA